MAVKAVNMVIKAAAGEIPTAASIQTHILDIQA
jgi:hypothetical protein